MRIKTTRLRSTILGFAEMRLRLVVVPILSAAVLKDDERQMRSVVMRTRKANGEPSKNIPMGKGATFEQFVATVGVDKLEIDVAPWGEGHLRVHGREIAQVKDRKDRRQAFRDLKQVAERCFRGQVDWAFPMFLASC
jgi:hypothetical protein